MASELKMWQVFGLFLALGAIAEAKIKPSPINLTEETWTNILEGEWLVKFYAPWCPACKSLVPTWQGVATWVDDLELGVSVADIDLTENPGLSGRFLITALPTIYHVKDGVFRVYRGARDESAFISYLEDKTWKDVEPVAWYFNPQSLHMSAVSSFFKLSIAIRDLHNKMTAEFGIPVWGSYTIFALVTIVMGLVLGLVIVWMCDLVWPPKHQASIRLQRQQKMQDIGKQSGDDESDVVEDDRYDALDPKQQQQQDVRPKTARHRRVPRTD